ncbi:MAG: hypothetical protein HFJ84_07815 [Clostridiales bacterium]|jgi:hypothetical protein|nr:hypothetical protein [Clostridiales bacterium]
MKRFLVIVLSALVVSVFFSGCSQEQNGKSLSSASPTQDEQSVVIPSKPEVGTTVATSRDEETRIAGLDLASREASYPLDTPWLTFDVYNERKDDYLFFYHGMELEVQTPDGWKTIVSSRVMEPPWVLFNNSKNEFQISLRDWDYDFQPGHYRLTMDVWNAEWGEVGDPWIAAEFDLTPGEPSKLPKSSAVVNTGKLVDGFLTPDRVSKNFRVELTQSTYSKQEDSWSFVLYNNTNKEISFGKRDVMLNVRINGEWYCLPKESVYLIAELVPAQSSTTIELDNLTNLISPSYQPEGFRAVFAEYGEWAFAEFDLVE